MRDHATGALVLLTLVDAALHVDLVEDLLERRIIGQSVEKLADGVLRLHGGHLRDRVE
jgi:hypothetical protein